MRSQKSAWVILAMLMAVFFLINTPFVWKWMYPIKYQSEIQAASARFEVDPHLVLAVIRTESAFRDNLVSKKGAVGLMQLMPDTAVWVKAQESFQSLSNPDLSEPIMNIDMGTWYLSFLIKMFNGNQTLAIAAYNAGPGNVTEWLARGQWDGSRERIEDIPYGETRHYVQRVLYYQDRYSKIYDEQLE
ncbi:lytic transglycosylase domain-containing protein [Brevibacillus dissolubilis]|uniref:lytic transglycosylase domain-containing protein n=1 Tax=Brevibacillus dissolubilis TaxID=1844116 RepID=UPI0011172F66|nr:lytic transglycosylase domain-containing protein [Brevibacillus dissolubilis]